MPRPHSDPNMKCAAQPGSRYPVLWIMVTSLCLPGTGCNESSGPREYTTTVVIGDLDADGLDDVFLTVRRREPIGCDDDETDCVGPREEVRGRVVWRIQDDSGRLGVRRRGDVGNVPRSLVLADLDRDGLVDVAVANEQNRGTISILLQDPVEPGKFRLRTYLNSAPKPVCVAAGDLNTDGFTDLVAASPENGLSLLLQDPAVPAQFLPETLLAPFANWVVVEDIDADGRDDILYTDGFEAVILFQDDESFQTIVLGEGIWPMSAAVGLLNGDDVPDVVVADAGEEGAPETAAVAVVFQSSETPRSFEVGLLLPADEGAVQVQVGDLNGDGLHDVATIGETRVAFIYRQDVSAPGSYLPPQRLVLAKLPSALAIGDLDGDGLQDLAVAQWALRHGAQVFPQNPEAPGEFKPPFAVGK